MKASIIIPTLNEEWCIKDTIDMWINQSYKNIEIIIVDGGSKDKTQSIVNTFIESYPNIKLIIAEKVGLGKSRNIGCKAATGEVIFQTDADIDFINKDYVKNAMSHFDDENVAGVYPKLEISEHTLIESTFKYRSENTEAKEWDIHPPILRRDIFVELGGASDLGFGEDRFFAKKFFNLIMTTSKKLTSENNSILRVHRVHTIQEYYKQQLWYGRTYPVFAKVSGYGAIKYVSFYGNTIFASLLFFIIFIPKYPILIINIFPVVAGGIYHIIKGIRKNKLSLYTLLFSLYIIGGFSKGIGLIMYLCGKKKVSSS